MIHKHIYRKNILLVDDEPANIKLLEKILRAQGYTNLMSIRDSREVMGKYQEFRPELILLDIKMPYLDGFRVMEMLHELNDPLLPPIIVLTAQNTKELLLKALAAGARDFITKPFDQNELIMRVRNLLDAHLAHHMLHDQKSVLEEMVRVRTEELQHSRLQVVRRLGMAAEFRDEETGNHILRMSHICAELAMAIGMSKDESELIMHASPMHDIGKIGIPDAILLKRGKLTPEEWVIMKTHTVIGANLLDGDDSELMRMAKDIAFTHHEKWDGSGYPNGLVGEEIPLSGRIAALADVFDALTSTRPYKKAWIIEDALNYILDQKMRHFDPELVDVMMNNLPKILEIKRTFSES